MRNTESGATNYRGRTQSQRGTASAAQSDVRNSDVRDLDLWFAQDNPRTVPDPFPDPFRESIPVMLDVAVKFCRR